MIKEFLPDNPGVLDTPVSALANLIIRARARLMGTLVRFRLLGDRETARPSLCPPRSAQRIATAKRSVVSLRVRSLLTRRFRCASRL